MKDLVIVGASGFGREVAQYVEDINKVTPRWNLLGFIDDNPNALDGVKCDYKVIGSIQDWEPHNEDYVCALAFPHVKEKMVQLLEERGAVFVSLIHPLSRVSRDACIGKGLIMTPYSNINTNAKVGDFVTILSSGIGHDAEVGSFSTLSGHCSINGHVKIGKSVYMGCNACIAPSKKIGDNVVIGMGSVVVSNVKEGTKVFGNPAKRILL